MIVWINGTFGVGKTTTANALLGRDGWRSFDPEHVGFLLAGNLRDREFRDFQDLPPWRVLVPAVADEIYRFTSPSAMIAVQTVLVADYWEELVAGFRYRGLPIFHVLLECDESELRRRITADEVESQALEWRLDHIAESRAARSWMADAADLVLDTTDVGPEAAADRIADALTAVLASDASLGRLGCQR
ncbi:AAA family ATPase [Ilumatobacter sp.]|uniref:AAA family ATPase n=1 Tax=Ilumatobacter sp. TaxID=1967498 RepID=UPI003B515633